ncbi:uncharacterized protein LOC133792095 [Humulus lupulus]|uniref:uncharacterized protein LOC133792095 n=1 Tax=Humulus lupulus TaxID=3486 RepID=UPI002B4176E7|nr:uncharacterized protein LOC133792095 [Humulus lupulus]
MDSGDFFDHYQVVVDSSVLKKDSKRARGESSKTPSKKARTEDAPATAPSKEGLPPPPLSEQTTPAPVNPRPSSKAVDKETLDHSSEGSLSSHIVGMARERIYRLSKHKRSQTTINDTATMHIDQIINRGLNEIASPPSSSSSSNNNGDPDPETSDLSHGAVEKEKEEEVSRVSIHQELARLELKENEEEPILKPDLEEKKEEKEEEKDEDRYLSGEEMGSRNGSDDGNENVNEDGYGNGSENENENEDEDEDEDEERKREVEENDGEDGGVRENKSGMRLKMAVK